MLRHPAVPALRSDSNDHAAHASISIQSLQLSSTLDRHPLHALVIKYTGSSPVGSGDAPAATRLLAYVYDGTRLGLNARSSVMRSRDSP